ncbi:MAG: phosphatidylserine/phosphatidylglycerophosphate/cardiolipin synthase family protein [Myxococcota bacterium]
MSRLLVTLVLVLVLGLSHEVRAAASPWVPVESETRLVGDPAVDLELRLYMIRQARSSVDLVLYEQGDDEAVGLPVLSALREAANRGVKVRVITQWFFQYLYHPFNESPSYTTNPPAAVPIEYVVFGSPTSVVRNGWHPSDGIHGKVLVVDRTWALTTGRGHAEMNLRWLDVSFAMKGPLAEHTAQAFDALWEDARTYGEVYKPAFTRPRPTAKQRRQHLPHYQAREGMAAELESLIHWLHRPRSVTTSTTGRGRVLHFDFVRQMARLKAERREPATWEERLTVLHDPMIDAFVERVERAGPGEEIRFTSMYAMLHPRAKQAVLTAHRRGVRVVMFTNEGLVAPPITTFAWMASLRDIDDLAAAGAEVYLFQKVSREPWDFLHLKLAVVGDTVFFGSHNLNVASSAANDEMAFEVEDPVLAADARAFFDENLRRNAYRLHPRAATPFRPLGVVGRMMLEPVLGFW